jgi:hypothetical protein
LPIHRLIETIPVAYPSRPSPLPSIGRLRFSGLQIVCGRLLIIDSTPIPRIPNLGTFNYAVAAVTATFVSPRHPPGVNCESTSSAVVKTSGNSNLRSSALRFLCKIPKRVTCNLRESCTGMAAV